MHVGEFAPWKVSGRAELVLFVVAGLLALLPAGACNSAAPLTMDTNLLAAYPQPGDATSYGMPLTVDNSQTFIDYEQQYKLTADQEAIKYEALTELRAPCCDDRTMYTCCCPCNLAKTVWGLSNYLIVEKSYDAATVRDSVVQWLHFIRPDYYAVQDLEAQGFDPADYGLHRVQSCYEGLCEEPFSRNGCGGMGALKL